MPTTLATPTREIQLRSATVDDAKRTIDAVVATEGRVTVMDSATWKLVDEVLLMTGVEYRDQIPLQQEHDRGLFANLGSARNIRVEGSGLAATLHFASDDEDADFIWRRIRDGHVDALSIGYRAIESTEIRPGDSRAVAGKTYTAGQTVLRVVTRWQLREVSVVTVGADAAAGTRLLNVQERGNAVRVRTFPSTTPDGQRAQPVAHRILDALEPELRRSDMRLSDVSKVCHNYLGLRTPENDRDAIREGLSHPAIGETFSALFGSAVLQGFHNEPDTTRGWVREISARRFLPSQLFTADEATRLEKLPRGGTAKHGGYSLVATEWAIARYAEKFSVSEEDMADDADIGALLLAAEQLGAAARRVRSDLIYSLLLRNPTLHDDVALFGGAHANLGTGALGAANLEIGVAAVGNQTLQDSQDDPIHVNLNARFLVVPPDLNATARGVARDLRLGDSSDLVVRSESRLGAGGVVDPDTDELVTGSATNWLLCAPHTRPSVVFGGLNGNLVPKIRGYELDQGQWGRGWDIVLDVGAAIVDYRGLYKSTGAA